MLLPIRTDSPPRATPWMNWALIVVNCLIFILTRNHPRWEARFWLNPGDPALIAYFTYAFLHAGIPHLVGNMLFLYLFGNNVNDRMGHGGYLAFYLAGAVVAGAGHVLASSQPVVGASGAVAAVTGAYLILLPRSNVVIPWFPRAAGTLEIPSLWFILIFFSQDAVMAIFPRWFGGAQAIAHVAHICGAAFGILLCLLLMRLRLLPRDEFDMLAVARRWSHRRRCRRMARTGLEPFGTHSSQEAATSAQRR